MVDHGAMKAYSEDLRRKVVQAVEERGTSKSEAARLFGISLSSVKRYAKLASEGGSLTPKKGVVGPPKPTNAQRGCSKKTYAPGPPPPSKRGAAFWRESLA